MAGASLTEDLLYSNAIPMGGGALDHALAPASNLISLFQVLRPFLVFTKRDGESELVGNMIHIWKSVKNSGTY